MVQCSGKDGEENPELKHSLLIPVQDKDAESHMERLFPFGITGISAPMYFFTLQVVEDQQWDGVESICYVAIN